MALRGRHLIEVRLRGMIRIFAPPMKRIRRRCGADRSLRLSTRVTRTLSVPKSTPATIVIQTAPGKRFQIRTPEYTIQSKLPHCNRKRPGLARSFLLPRQHGRQSAKNRVFAVRWRGSRGRGGFGRSAAGTLTAWPVFARQERPASLGAGVSSDPHCLPGFLAEPRRARSFHKNGYSAVRWVVGVAFHAQKLVGVAAHLGHLVGAHTVLLHQPPRRVGPVRGELPVAVIGIGGVLRRVGVALDQQRLGSVFNSAPAAPAAPARCRSVARCRSGRTCRSCPRSVRCADPRR